MQYSIYVMGLRSYASGFRQEESAWRWASPGLARRPPAPALAAPVRSGIDLLGGRRRIEQPLERFRLLLEASLGSPANSFLEDQRRRWRSRRGERGGVTGKGNRLAEPVADFAVNG